MTAPDFVTVLYCADGKRAAKRYTDPFVPPDGFDAGYLFDVEEAPVSSLADLAALVEKHRRNPRVMFVRGRYVGGAPAKSVQRLCRPRPDAPATFTAADHRWVMVDLDKGGPPYDPADPRGSVQRWRESLPPGLRDAEMLFQFSASAHISETVRGHALFWLDAPVGDGQLRAWASARGLDRSLYNPVHPHYIADPIFDGCADVMNGSRAPMTFAGNPARAADILSFPATAATRALAVNEVELGDPVETPPYLAAATGLFGVLGDPADHQGHRFPLVSALGGLLCKSGWPAANTAELIRTWLDVGDPAIDVELGVSRALGAYELEDPHTASGVSEIAQILGDETAEALRAQAERGSGRAVPLTPAQAEGMARRRAERAQAPASVALVTAPTLENPYPTLGPWLDFEGEPPPPKWLCEGLGIEAGGKPSALAGLPNAGKGPFSNLFSISVALGLPFLGKFDVAQTNVLVLDWETGSRVSRRRVWRMCNSLGVDPAGLRGKLFFSSLAGGVNADRMRDINAVIGDEGIGLVIIDSYTSAMMSAGLDGNAKEYAAFLADLGEISQAHDTVIMPLMHAKKPDGRGKASHRRPGLADISGSGALGAYLQAVVMLWYPDPEDKNTVEVSCARSTEEAFHPFSVRWEDEPQPGGFGAAVVKPKWGLKATLLQPAEKPPQPAPLNAANARRAQEAAARRDQARTRIKKAFTLSNEGSADMKRLAEIAGGHRRAAQEVVAEMVDAGVMLDNGGVYMWNHNAPNAFQQMLNRLGMTQGKP